MEYRKGAAPMGPFLRLRLALPVTSAIPSEIVVACPQLFSAGTVVAAVDAFKAR